MVVSELQSRLEHLVTYSSQLIFISGDSIASQQRSVQSFIAQQSDSTEIAFINAEARFSLADYRQQITTQLLGPNRARTARPLNELLAPLREHDGPILIFICQAEHLPRPVLQELWELVLQSRFAGNRQHLNVLLFGESNWAEEAKAWLPANNREKPLLLSTESVSTTPQPASELDQLIAQKRAEFERRLSEREQLTYTVPDKTSKWPLLLMASLSFIALFGAAMAWLYQDQVSALWWELTHEDPTPIEQVVTQQPAAEIEDEASLSAETTTPADEEQPHSPAETSQTEPEAPPAAPETDAALSEDGQQLVTSWQDAVERIPDPEDVFGDETDESGVVELASVAPPPQFEDSSVAATFPAPEPASTDNTDSNQSDASRAIAPENVPPTVTDNDALELTASEPANETGYDVVDYPVEDIVSVDQLPENTNADAPSTANLQGTQFETVPELSPQHFVIQVAGLSDQRLLQEFLTDNNLQDKVWVYRTLRQDQPWYVVLVNRAFDDRNSAMQATQSLPPAMQTGAPFIKSVRAVLNEMALNTAQ